MTPSLLGTNSQPFMDHFNQHLAEKGFRPFVERSIFDSALFKKSKESIFNATLSELPSTKLSPEQSKIKKIDLLEKSLEETEKKLATLKNNVDPTAQGLSQLVKCRAILERLCAREPGATISERYTSLVAKQSTSYSQQAEDMKDLLGRETSKVLSAVASMYEQKFY